ncbi:MAG: DNA mismatch repair protein MutS [Alphaproteobacteria bacterium]
MMAQWHALKSEHPDCLLFFRMGDFFELFFDDAVAAAAALDITLTHRGSHGGAPVPMAGVPVHAAEMYLSRLIRRDFRVAICDQVEDPAEARKRGPKAIVARAVVRVVTPGTLTEDSLLEPRANNYLAALAQAGSQLGLAWLDISTGELWLQPLPEGTLVAALARVGPGELLVPEYLLQRPDLFDFFAEHKKILTPLPGTRLDSANGARRLMDLYKVQALDAFGDPTRAELAAAGGLIDYVELTQAGKLPRIERPRRMPAPGASGAAMEIDPATRRNLELTRTLGGERKGSLLALMDYTVTNGGGRLLAARLSAPLTDIAVIEGRLDAVGYFHGNTTLRGDLRAALRGCPDMERGLSRLSIGRAGPRDLAAIRDGLSVTESIQVVLGPAGADSLPKAVQADCQHLGQHSNLIDRLTRALGPDLPLNARDGGFIAPEYAVELDQQRALRDESRRLIAGLQQRYVEMAGINALKIRHNNVLGYYIEVPAGQAGKLIGPDAQADHLPFQHRQTMANAVRFSTPDLAELADKIGRAGERALAIEQALFKDLVGEVLARAEDISRTAAGLAGLDVASALAELALQRDYCRPRIDESRIFAIQGGRHPVVEEALRSTGGAFVANACDLSHDQRIWLLTGPNMAGKSTFLRQNALIVILAQLGSFVPAASAHIGIVDRLFSRVGAADDLARGRSTFMVEMVEAATILNQATDRSLVIFDEIGRGTATFDGLSIAWATVEHLHDTNRARARFATHYHELTSLAAKLPSLACFTMRVKEWQGDVVFLHEVAAGSADRSYGIHVAKLAGLPPPVIARAEQVLAILEKGEQGGALTRLAEDLPLFRAAPPPRPKGPSPLQEKLTATDPDRLTPRDALELLYVLKDLARGDG